MLALQCRRGIFASCCPIRNRLLGDDEPHPGAGDRSIPDGLQATKHRDGPGSGFKLGTTLG